MQISYGGMDALEINRFYVAFIDINVNDIELRACLLQRSEVCNRMLPLQWLLASCGCD